MKLRQLLLESRDTIVSEWTEAIFRTYPIDTVGFMRRQHDQFANPIGYRTRLAAAAMVDGLLGVETAVKGEDGQAFGLNEALNDLIRIRAVQDFTPAGAAGFFVLLKKIVRKLAENALTDVAVVKDLLAFEDKLDALTLLALNIYMERHKQIFEMRVKEVKNSQAWLLKRAKMICEPTAED